METPTILTERLILRSFAGQDSVALCRIMNQEDVLRYFPNTRPPALETVERLIGRQLQHWQEHGYGWWAVELRAEPGLIGWNGLQYLPDTDEVEVGYLLGREHWGRGLAVEGAWEGLRYGFDELGLQEIVGIVHPENVASQRVLEKLGMVRTARTEYFGMPVYRYAIKAADLDASAGGVMETVNAESHEAEKPDARKSYLEGYAAFERGDFERANSLADECLASSSPSSYWYAGALGLKCWAATLGDKLPELDRSATTLLALDTGADKPWFDGIALLNLALVHRKHGDWGQARQLFLRASESYAAQQLHPNQPGEWQNVLDYFSTLCRWAANGNTGEWSNLLDQFAGGARKPSDLMNELIGAARLMLRYAEGDQVGEAAIKLARQGTSRTFLSCLLLS